MTNLIGGNGLKGERYKVNKLIIKKMSDDEWAEVKTKKKFKPMTQ